MSDVRASARQALPLWAASRVAALVLTVGAAWLLPPGDKGARPRLLELWHHWDTDLFRKVAEHGYFSPAYQDRAEAFFPGQPLAMRLVHVVVRDWLATGLVVTALAMAVACVALHRLATDDSGDEEGGRRAVLYLLVFPYSVFLVAGYSEALFLAFALTAWLAARRGSWWVAGLLAAGASATRVTGVALGAALAVEYLVQRRGRLSRDVLALGLPVLSVLGYVTYLHARTGHWDAYQRALAEGWGRHVVAPWHAWANTWHAAFAPGTARPYAWSWRVELIAMALGVLLTLVLLRGRRWSEATFVGVNVAILSTSSYYASGVRALMVWFPAYLLLTRVSLRTRGVHTAVVAVAAPLSVLTTLAFLEGTWLG